MDGRQAVLREDAVVLVAALAVVRVDDGGLLVGYRAPTPAGLLPG